MTNTTIPQLTEQEIQDGLKEADASPRRRYPKILHKQGAEFNEVINFMMQDSYMQPHLHPGPEKIEKIYLVQGKLATLFFDDHGVVKQCTILEKGGTEMIEVPAFTWHTYVMLSDSAITYETMMGKYDPQTWKDFFTIAPPENSPESMPYLQTLKVEAEKWRW
jgi:cupin fold WbuC family metalloprotein